MSSGVPTTRLVRKTFTQYKAESLLFRTRLSLKSKALKNLALILSSEKQRVAMTRSCVTLKSSYRVYAYKALDVSGRVGSLKMDLWTALM